MVVEVEKPKYSGQRQESLHVEPLKQIVYMVIEM